MIKEVRRQPCLWCKHYACQQERKTGVRRHQTRYPNRAHHEVPLQEDRGVRPRCGTKVRQQLKRRISSAETEEHPTPLALTNSDEVTMDTIPAIGDTSPIQFPSPTGECGESAQMSIRDRLEVIGAYCSADVPSERDPEVRGCHPNIGFRDEGNATGT